MTADTAEQLKSRLRSRAWRIQNLHTILAKGEGDDNTVGLRKFTPNIAQRAYFNERHNLDAILKARKLGLSTFKAIEFCDDSQFIPRVTLGIIDNKLEDAMTKLGMVLTSYQNMDNGDLHPDTWRLGREIKRRNPLVTNAKKELEWKNGAKLKVDTAFRGSNPNKLHLSEFGKIAAFFPKKATEIVNGAFNSILPGMEMTSESTHEGGKSGEHYKLLSTAMENSNLSHLSPLDWKFFFFPWWKHPLYKIPANGRKLRPSIIKYFDDLANIHNIRVSPEQMFWYDRKELEQGYGMKKEFPTTPGEAFEALVTGAIWGRDIADLRAAGRVTDLACGPEPLFTFWDLGYSDFTAIWLIQICGRDVLVHRFHQNHRLHTGRYVEVIRQWEREFNCTISQHFLPHDADSHGGGGISPIELLEQGGISRREITVVPRSPDVWPGINNARSLLGRAYFDKKGTDTQYQRDGEDQPSGLTCLENYRTRTNTQEGYETNTIVHDEYSHPADAFRTFATADLEGLIRHSANKQPPRHAAIEIPAFSPTHRRR